MVVDFVFFAGVFVGNKKNEWLSDNPPLLVELHKITDTYSIPYERISPSVGFVSKICDSISHYNSILIIQI